MDTEIVKSIRNYIRRIPQVRELDFDEALQAVESVAEKYIENRKSVWWWESVKCETTCLDYGDNDGLSLIKEVVGEDCIVLLFVTDDEPEPWPVFEGSIGGVIDIFSEQPFFEYFLTGRDFSWIIFDTHHNSLIISGAAKRCSTKPGKTPKHAKFVK